MMIPFIIFWDHFYTVKIKKEEYYKKPYRKVFITKKPKKLKKVEIPDTVPVEAEGEDQKEGEGEGEKEPEPEKEEEKSKTEEQPSESQPPESSVFSEAEGEDSEDESSRSETSQPPSDSRDESSVEESKGNVNVIYQDPNKGSDLDISIDPAEVNNDGARGDDIANQATGANFGTGGRRLQR